MAEFSITTLESPIGELVIKAREDAIVSVTFLSGGDQIIESDSPLLDECKKQLKEYFEGKRFEFVIPIAQDGTDFQKQVWKEVSKVEFGKTASYKDISLQLDNPNAVRAIGSANGQNKILILIPCHRIIGHNGTLVGYAGEIWRKQYLLEHECKYSGKLSQLRLF